MLSVLYFDLLGMRAAIHSDRGLASDQLLQLSTLLPALTQGAGWDYGFHLSDTTFLVHRDRNAAILEAIKIWQASFNYDARSLGLPRFVFGIDDPDDYRGLSLACLPRGAIVTGKIELLPRIRWQRGHGFVRTEREVLLNHDKGERPDEISIVLSEQAEDLMVNYAALPEGGAKKIYLVGKRLDGEEILGVVPIDPDGGLDVLHVAEIGNITGRAIVEAVQLADGSGLKGPRLLLNNDAGLSDALRKYLHPVPGSQAFDVVWLADFADGGRTAGMCHRAVERWLEYRAAPPAVRIHYDALLSLAAIGMSRVAEEDGAWEWLGMNLSSLLQRLVHEGGIPPTSGPAASIAHHLARCPGFDANMLSEGARTALSLPAEALRSLAFAPLTAAQGGGKGV